MDESLSPETREELQQRLQTRFAELQEWVRSELLSYESQRYNDVAGQVYDPGDASVADLISDLELGLLDRDLQELRDVENALAKLRGGRYGECESCGEPIAVERLRVYPEARRCIDCQQRLETETEGRRSPTM